MAYICFCCQHVPLRAFMPYPSTLLRLKTIKTVKMSQTVTLDNLCYSCCCHECTHTVVWLELIPFCCCKYSLKHKMFILSLKIVPNKCSIYFCLSNVGYSETTLQLLFDFEDCFLPNRYERCRTWLKKEMFKDQTDSVLVLWVTGINTFTLRSN